MSIIECVISNVAIATALALLAALVGRVTTKPQIAHTLWVLVLVKLVTPPVVHIPVGYPVSTTVALESSGDSAKNAMSELLSASNDEPIERDEELGAHAVRSMEVPGFPFVPNQGADTNSSISTFALHVSWTKALVGVWVAGALLWFLLATTRLLRFRNVLRYAHPASEEIKTEISTIASRYGLRDIPRVLVADAKVPPLIWGFGGRTSMILPSGLLNKMGPVERTGLIAHELAHLKRYDHWIRWFEFVVLGIYWWNPVAWWARAKLQQSEEECCDAWVLWMFPNNGRQYAQALLDTVDFLADSSQRKPEIATAFNQGNSLKRRIEMIVNAKVYRRLSGKMRGVLVLFALTVAPLSLLGSQSGHTDMSEATRHEKVISSDKDKPVINDDNSQSAKTRQVEPRKPASNEATKWFHPIRGDELVNRELEKFQGVWALESYTIEGETKSADEEGTTFRGLRMIVNGNHWVDRNYGISLDIPFEDNRWARMQFGVNPRKSPARIDIWPVNRPDGWRKLGIYRLEEDKLTICYSILVLGGDDVKRPTKFDARDGSRAGLAVYKRLPRR